MLNSQKIKVAKKQFYNNFPEYVGKNDKDSEKALNIFLSGFESSLPEAKEFTLSLVTEKQTDPITDILDYLNKARKKISKNEAARGFRKTNIITSTINARIKEGYVKEDFHMVIDHKCKEWKGTAFQQYIRPSTLFSPSHFSEYLCEAESKKKVYSSEVDQEISKLMEG